MSVGRARGEMEKNTRGRGTGALLLFSVGLLVGLGLVDALAWFVLSKGVTGNPLAFAKMEAALHIFAPSEGPLYFSVKPNYRQRMRTVEFMSEIRTNNLGFREDEDFYGGHLDIAVVGDSFAFGAQVQHGERFSDVLRADFPDRRIMNFSYANGYSPPHYLAYLNENPELIPDLLVVALFPYNDFLNDMDDADLGRDRNGDLLYVGAKTRAISSEGFLIQKGSLDHKPWWFDGLRKLHAGRILLMASGRVGRWWAGLGAPTGLPSTSQSGGPLPGSMDRGEMPPSAIEALGYVQELNVLMAQHGGQMLVFYIPAPYMVGEYSTACRYGISICRAAAQGNGLGNFMSGWFADAGIAFIDPTTRFRALEADGVRLHLVEDAHWGATGHAEAGRLIMEYIRDNPGLLPPIGN